jgi:hypothetical protein
MWWLLVIALSCAPFALSVQHENLPYLPLSSREIGSPFALKGLGLVKDGSPLVTRAGPSGSSFSLDRRADHEILVLDGKDRSGKPWHIDLIENGDQARVYEDDLNNDKVWDALLVMPTGGVGLAPLVHLIAVTFDEKGRPIPWETEGYFGETNSGIDSLVDLDHNGIADLIFMNFDDGYWITNVYSLKGARWSRVHGALIGHSFPMFTRFTNRPNTVAVTPPPNRHPWAPELSNAAPVITGVLTSWKWPSGDLSHGASDLDLQLTIQASGKEIVCTPSYWYDSARVVLDQIEGRTIRVVSTSSRTIDDEVFRDLVSKKIQVQLYGQRYRDRCSPDLIWATFD